MVYEEVIMDCTHQIPIFNVYLKRRKNLLDYISPTTNWLLMLVQYTEVSLNALVMFIN